MGAQRLESKGLVVPLTLLLLRLAILFVSFSYSVTTHPSILTLYPLEVVYVSLRGRVD